MCGLAGLFHPDRDGAVDAALLRRMTAALAHRGPDGDGFHLEPGIGFGHRRLAIIDPTGGEQPMFNEDQSVVIVFNGMIYNYQALMAELQALGQSWFATWQAVTLALAQQKVSAQIPATQATTLAGLGVPTDPALLAQGAVAAGLA